MNLLPVPLVAEVVYLARTEKMTYLNSIESFRHKKPKLFIRIVEGIKSKLPFITPSDMTNIVLCVRLLGSNNKFYDGWCELSTLNL